MSATEFTADVRDIRFVLHEQLEAMAAVSQHERYADCDVELADNLIDEGYKLCREVLWPINLSGDEQGCSLDSEGNVTTPEGYAAAWKIVSEGGWHGFHGDPEYGGMGMPSCLDAVMGELWTGAAVAFSMYGGLSRGVAHVMSEYGPEDIRTLVCEKIFNGEWNGTMCLTEPGAGSDVGANRTKAVPVAGRPGFYELTGEKIFISCGDAEFTENTVHLVLARVPGAPEGTRGLSIFLVSKYNWTDDGGLGARNGAYVEKIEHKMGISGSATCAISFGARGRCVGRLLGEEGQGLKIMFHMMNEARLEVAVQGLGGAATAYELSKAYAKERIQGVDITEHDKEGAKDVAIIRHPDVRRNLMWQRVHVETMRSLVYKTALRIDHAHCLEDKDAKREAKGYVELMTPVLKAYCSDKGFDSAVIGLQVLGGYGYIKEYPLEQVVRDTKIASIYEGTNGIQAMDLLGRKMAKGSGVLFMNWLNEINAELDRCRELDELSDALTAVEKARDSLGASAMHLGGLGMQGQVRDAMLQATPFLDQFGCVALGVEAMEQARVALTRLRQGGDSLSDRDVAFYKGKVLNAKFYAANVLPRSIAVGKSIRLGDTSCLDDSLFA